MNTLYNEISQKVIMKADDIEYTNLLEYKEYVVRKEITIKTPAGTEKKVVSVWSEAISHALNENKAVFIPDIGDEIYIDQSITMRSEYKLKIDKEQRIVLLPDTGVCMLRNDNIISGNEQPVELQNPDEGIYIEGGIWDALEYSFSLGNGNTRLAADKETPVTGVLAIMLLSNVRNVLLKNITFANSRSYAVQICNCEGFFIDNVCFENYHKDGIHINGPAKYGVVRELYGKNMGDDMVALNAWDWNTSAMCFGTIEKVIVENLYSDHNEFRLLPGRKTFSDNRFVDCELRDCVIRNIEGVYTFKLYGQPNVNNISDCSEIVGDIKNIYFDNVTFPKVTATGLNGLPVQGLFEVCANTENIHIDNIKINNAKSDFEEMNVSVVKAGPLSAVWTKGSDNPEDWTEVFSPDDICTMDNTYIGKIEFFDGEATKEDKAIVAKAIRLTINEDYPDTTPRGGTGYGIINDVIFK